jgi:hypothetical protein
MKRKESQLKESIAETVLLIAKELENRKMQRSHYGDISDLGNEIGYSVGNVIKYMTETETNDFIHGIRHGISITNGTH